jgi:hypothetical protein
MYTGKTEQPCCLCDDPETVARLDLPPRAVTLMKHGGRIAWRDIVGDVSVHFCASDWELVCDLVVDLGQNPLSRCSVARASFDLRADFEALTRIRKDEPDQSALEAERLRESTRVVDRYGDDPMVETRDYVEARVVQWTLEDLGVADGVESGH